MLRPLPMRLASAVSAKIAPAAITPASAKIPAFLKKKLRKPRDWGLRESNISNP
jgi:hypothetical protein